MSKQKDPLDLNKDRDKNTVFRILFEDSGRLEEKFDDVSDTDGEDFIECRSENSNSEQSDDDLEPQEGNQLVQPEIADQPADWSTDQPADQPADQPTEHPLDQHADQPMDQPGDQPMDQRADQPMDQPADQPMDHPANQPGDQPMDHPADQPMDQPADQPVDPPAVVPADQPQPPGIDLQPLAPQLRVQQIRRAQHLRMNADPNDNLHFKAKLGKDTFMKWFLKPRACNISRVLPQNILRRLPGVIGNARQAKSELECWQNFFNDEILQKIVGYTNQYIEVVQDNYSRSRDAKPTDLIELKACIGILYLLGVFRSNRQSLEEIWSTDGFGIEKCRLVFSLRRFKFLIRCLRFDDCQTRPVRRQTDNIAAIREVFDAFVLNCRRAYSLGDNVTIDEKLEAFRGRCRFRQYIPSKPAKYGIKIFAVCDSKTFYTSNMEIYCGRQPEGPFKISNKSEDVVKRLAAPLYNSGRNITADNWFSSLPLVEFLKTQKLSYVGTVKKNRQGIPQEMKIVKDRPVESSLFAFTKNSTLVSYVPKKSKNVLLISTLHFKDEIDAESNKPEIVVHYNKTKSGVDCVDKLCSSYNVARNTNRWPMVVFYAMINVAGINAQVVSLCNNTDTKLRRLFLRALSDSLVTEHLQRRCESIPVGGVPLSIQEKLKKRVRLEPNADQNAEEERRLLDKRTRCELCKIDKKTRLTKFTCKNCDKAICLQHAEYVCVSCYPNMKYQTKPTEDIE